MTQTPTSENPSPDASVEADVRPQRPRPAPTQLAVVDPPNAWRNNPRRMSLVMLIVTFVVFVMACMFFSRLTTWSYLYVKWPPTSYWDSLGQFMLDPHINIYRAIWQALVMALLLATFVATPILIAQYYGWWWMLLFLAPLAALAHLPLLALTVLAAGWLARGPRFGLTNRPLLGLLALILPVAELWLSTHQTEFGQESKPMGQLFLHAPWLGAAAIALVTVILFWVLARVINYRAFLAPVPPAALLIASLVVFLTCVGMDELEFRLLDAECGLSSPNGFKSGPAAQAGDLETSRREVAKSCADFLERFPTSRYAPYVCYLLGRSRDMRAIARDGQVVYYSDVPAKSSEAAWKRLLNRWPKDPLAVIARVRLAQLSLASGDFDRGRKLLSDARVRRKAIKPLRARRSYLGWLPRDPDIRSLVEQDTGDLLDWLFIVTRNTSADQADRDVLAGLFALDPHRPDYLDGLLKLQNGYHGVLAAELKVLVCLEQPGHDAKAALDARIGKLNEFVKSHAAGSDSDAELFATSKLATLLGEAQADQSRPKEQREQFEQQASGYWKRLIESRNDILVEKAAKSLRTAGRLGAASQPDDQDNDGTPDSQEEEGATGDQ